MGTASKESREEIAILKGGLVAEANDDKSE
jgi:hypothetical protein